MKLEKRRRHGKHAATTSLAWPCSNSQPVAVTKAGHPRQKHNSVPTPNTSLTDRYEHIHRTSTLSAPGGMRYKLAVMRSPRFRTSSAAAALASCCRNANTRPRAFFSAPATAAASRAWSAAWASPACVCMCTRYTRAWVPSGCGQTWQGLRAEQLASSQSCACRNTEHCPITQSREISALIRQQHTQLCEI